MSTDTDTTTLTIWALHGQEVTDTGSTPGASVYRGRREDLPFGGWTSQGYALERVEQLTVSPEQARALGVDTSKESTPWQGYAVERVEQLTVSPEQARALGVDTSKESTP